MTRKEVVGLLEPLYAYADYLEGVMAHEARVGEKAEEHRECRAKHAEELRNRLREVVMSTKERPTP